MNWNQYEEKYRLAGQKLNVPDELVSRNLNYAKPLFLKDLPIIFDGTHLSRLVGYRKSYIDRATQFTTYFYRHFSIPKKNGDKRRMAEPLPSLKEIQYWILNEILSKQSVSNFAKAYRKNHSVKSNARFHLDQTKVLCMDLSDFFGTINKNQVVQLFRDIGYSSTVSKYLAGLCTLYNCLPQGAPTSPIISNIIAKNLDKAISEYCISNGLRYTRYSDDITISGDFSEGIVVNNLKNIIEENGFTVNDSKTRVFTKAQRQLITGIVVNNGMRAPKETRRKFRQSVHYIRVYGLESHLEKINQKRRNYLDHLIGTGNFILFVNPEDIEVQENLLFLKEIKKSL